MEFLSFGRPTLGVSLQDVDSELGRYFEVEQGALVLDVMEDSAAQEAGLQKGDVIVEADGNEIAETEDLHDVLDDFEAGEELALVVVRDGKRENISAELDESSAGIRGSMAS